MKRASMAIAAVAMTFSVGARAEVLQFSKISCDEFVKADQATIGNLLMWLGGYYMGDDDDAVIDFDKLKKQGGDLGKYCAEHPTAKLSDAAEKIMGE